MNTTYTTVCGCAACWVSYWLGDPLARDASTADLTDDELASGITELELEKASS